MIRVVVSAAAPDPVWIERAASTLRAGGIGAIPTDTLYGLAANPFDGTAVSRLFTIKNRDLERALPLVAADLGQVRACVGVITPLADRLADRFWPGPLTLVFAAPPLSRPR